MNQEMNTIEMAKLYESQGYHEDAYQIYSGLDQQNSTSQTRAGISRMKTKMTAGVELNNSSGDPGAGSRIRLAHLLEKWLNLIVLKHRLDRFKKIKSRLR